ncbi:hypothetical protein SHTP_1326 [Mycobacterium ulcerans subsp. shinshuense]|uniref:Uncharacterized protein n=2 Tax=Mycobacterium ulcerans TaxID=1809 RepID=A0A1B4Y0K9_MYCUL|nr:conserved hypothetical protein [Mycobacterium ulcerans Agy99]BAV40598.1 hypothetical protein SHTP_1326 [Mycobacterium ulcerans subsp. shinshuense]
MHQRDQSRHDQREQDKSKHSGDGQVRQDDGHDLLTFLRATDLGRSGAELVCGCGLFECAPLRSVRKLIAVRARCDVVKRPTLGPDLLSGDEPKPIGGTTMVSAPGQS